MQRKSAQRCTTQIKWPEGKLAAFTEVQLKKSWKNVVDGTFFFLDNFNK